MKYPHSSKVSAPQVDVSHYAGTYDHRGRWSSYWHQIQLMKEAHDNAPALEIGIGNGLVSRYLRFTLGWELTTVDIDSALSPDVVADIVDLPFSSGSFSVAAACEVLEHIPYEKSELALVELRRVARRAVISVPNVGQCWQTSISFNSRTKHFLFEPPFQVRSSRPQVEDQHYWELGLKDYSVGRFKQSLYHAGWHIDRDFRNPFMSFHHFFLLS